MFKDVHISRVRFVDNASAFISQITFLSRISQNKMNLLSMYNFKPVAGSVNHFPVIRFSHILVPLSDSSCDCIGIDVDLAA